VTRAEWAHRSRSAGNGLLVALSLMSFHASHAQIQEVAPYIPLSLEAAHTQRTLANSLKADAEKQYSLDTTECKKKSSPNGCFDIAAKNRQKSLADSRRLEREGRQGEREARNLERQRKEAQRLADVPRREAEEMARIAKLHQEKARRDAEREVKLAKETADRAQRRIKMRAEEVARHKRHMEMARIDAEREKLRPMHLRDQHATEREYAEHAAKIDARKMQIAKDEMKRETEVVAKLAADEAARRNPLKKSSILCELWRGRSSCTGSGTSM